MIRKYPEYYTASVERISDELGFNDRSTLVGHFVLSPREREKRDSRGDEREEQGRKRYRNESEETEKKQKKTFPLYPCLPQG